MDNGNVFDVSKSKHVNVHINTHNLRQQIMYNMTAVQRLIYLAIRVRLSRIS